MYNVVKAQAGEGMSQVPYTVTEARKKKKVGMSVIHVDRSYRGTSLGVVVVMTRPGIVRSYYSGQDLECGWIESSPLRKT